MWWGSFEGLSDVTVNSFTPSEQIDARLSGFSSLTLVGFGLLSYFRNPLLITPSNDFPSYIIYFTV